MARFSLPKITRFHILITLVVISIGFNVFLAWPVVAKKLNTDNINDNQKITQIEQYVGSISPAYVTEVQEVAQQNNSPTWGCGPSSYALAVLIDRKFFDNSLPIDNSYNNGRYEILERFGLAQSGSSVIDHGWIEIYLDSQILFIDPTIGQFGKYTGIVYQVFSIGDPNLQQELQTKYGILDVRLSLLFQKAVDRVPRDSSPYPGSTINPADLPYYQAIMTERTELNNDQEPTEWKDWVSAILAKFS